MYKAALDFGSESVSEPARVDRWPVTVGFVKDPDGYLVEFVQRHPWLDGDDTTQLLARPVLHQRERHRRRDQVLGDARPRVHEPDRHPGREGSDPREHRQGRQGSARAADVAARPDRHGDRDVEALRLHRRLQRPLRPGRSPPATRSVTEPVRLERWPTRSRSSPTPTTTKSSSSSVTRSRPTHGVAHCEPRYPAAAGRS